MANRALDRKKAIRWARYSGRAARLVGAPERPTSQALTDLINREQGAFFAVLRQTSRG